MSICISSEHRLLTEDVLTQLRQDVGFHSLVHAMREENRRVADWANLLDAAQVHLACQQSINWLLEEMALELPAKPLDPAEFAQAVYALPRIPRTAPCRRMVREVARIYAQTCTDGLPIPKQPDDFHALWECAMVGEPRWSEEDSSPSFRPAAARILSGRSWKTVLQVCVDPADYEAELVHLLAFFQDATLEPEVRAACGYALFEWIHPFIDGNGHVGRMLALSILRDVYTLPTMVCFSWALVQGRGRTSRLFALLRSGEGTLVDFCRGTLEQLHGAQAFARDMVAEA